MTIRFRILRGENQARSRITALDFRREDLAWLRTSSGRILWKSPGAKRGPWQRVKFQRSLPLCSKSICPHVQELKQRWQEAWMDEKGGPEKTQRESIQDVEREVCEPRKNTKAMFNHTEIGLGKPKSTSSWRMGKGTRKVSTSTVAAKGKSGENWASCWKIQGTSKRPTHSSWYRKYLFSSH